MDHREIEIDRGRYEAGAALLARLDEMSMGVTTAGWFYDAPTKSWRLVLVTALVEEKGARWVYERLLKAFRFIADTSKIIPLNVTVSAMAEPFFGPLSVSFSNAGSLDLSDISMNGRTIISRARLYRANHRAVRRSAALFDRAVHKLAA